MMVMVNPQIERICEETVRARACVWENAWGVTAGKEWARNKVGVAETQGSGRVRAGYLNTVPPTTVPTPDTSNDSHTRNSAHRMEQPKRGEKKKQHR